MENDSCLRMCHEIINNEFVLFDTDDPRNMTQVLSISRQSFRHFKKNNTICFLLLAGLQGHRSKMSACKYILNLYPDYFCKKNMNVNFMNINSFCIKSIRNESPSNISCSDILKCIVK